MSDQKAPDFLGASDQGRKDVFWVGMIGTRAHSDVVVLVVDGVVAAVLVFLPLLWLLLLLLQPSSVPASFQLVPASLQHRGNTLLHIPNVHQPLYSHSQ